MEFDPPQQQLFVVRIKLQFVKLHPACLQASVEESNCPLGIMWQYEIELSSIRLLGGINGARIALWLTQQLSLHRWSTGQVTALRDSRRPRPRPSSSLPAPLSWTCLTEMSRILARQSAPPKCSRRARWSRGLNATKRSRRNNRDANHPVNCLPKVINQCD